MKHVSFTKILSLLLCVVMFVTMLPGTYAFADEEEVEAAPAETVAAEAPAEETASEPAE